MRVVLAGLFLLLLQSVSMAQATGEIEQIGFEGLYRPECWVPMLIRIRSETGAPQSLQIRISQDDLDRDHVIYSQPIDLGGNGESSQTVEHYWVYFRPTPNDGGLPNNSVSDLSRVLHVNLCTADGKKVVAPIKVTSTVSPIDSRGPGTPRSTRLIVCVTDSGDSPMYAEYGQSKGALTDVAMLPVKPDDLPDDVLGYQAVDAIVWFDADANKLTEGTKTPVLRAIEDYVHQGGQLVVCQPPGQPSHIEPFASMLPIVTTDNAGRFSIPMDDCGDTDALRSLAGLSPAPRLPSTTQSASTTFRLARATPLSTALVDCWMDWPTDGKGPTRTPYLARIAVGNGVVTWIAQDLGDRVVHKQIPYGWPFIWNRVFDWHDEGLVLITDANREKTDAAWQAMASVDLGGYMQSDLDLTSKTAQLVSVAVLFFLAYWAIAGPGVYLFLLSRRQSEQSWFAFAAIALVATGLTVFVVWAVLRGAPELRHSTLVRIGPGEPEQVYTRFGLYIPRDGNQTVELKNASDRAASFITPLGVIPGDPANQQLGFTVPATYNVPIHKIDMKDPLSISVPYRSTLKKLEASWVGQPGDPGKTIIGLPRLTGGRHPLTGTLTNNTGADLHDVYICYRMAYADNSDLPRQPYDELFFVPEWNKDADLNLTKIQMPADDITDPASPRMMAEVDGHDQTPGQSGLHPLSNLIGTLGGWAAYWQEKIAARGDDFAKSTGEAFILLSLYQRIALVAPAPSGSNRAELLRRDGRQFDVSNAVAGGRLVILAGVTDQPDPAPLLVDGLPPAGSGTVYEQFILPLDRSSVSSGGAAPTTRQNLNQLEKNIGNMINNGDK